MIKKIFIATTIMFIFACSSDNSDNILDLQENTLKNNTFEPSNFLYSMLSESKVEAITALELNRYEVRTEDGIVYVQILELEGEEIVDVSAEAGSKRITFHEEDEKITILDNKTEDFLELISFSDESQELDAFLKTAITMHFYSVENPNRDFNIDAEPRNLTYWCFRKRKSACDSEAFINDYCGGEPSSMGGTDCGCLWGDFGCVCVTDFEC